MIDWTRWDGNVVEGVHGSIYFYRKLYAGEHAELFPRAKELDRDGEVIRNLVSLANDKFTKARVPYIIANVSKLIPEIPAMLVSRAIGRVSPANDMDHSEDVRELQKVILEEIEEDSNLVFEHYTNILQHQIDGGLVGIVTKEMDDAPVIEMKARDTYFPHDDGRGADIAIEESFENEDGELEKYLHIYRERIEREKGRDPVTKRRTSKLVITHMLYEVKSGGLLERLEDDEAMNILGYDELEITYPDRTRGFIEYWANNKTFDEPLGTSALKGQDSKQEEINWTLTRSAIIFEQNGKPKIAVNKQIMKALADEAYDRTGDERRIDARNLEIVEMDQDGRALEVYQIDISKIGNIQWVKDLAKLMFIETQTSEKAVDFYLDGSSSAQSGIAKFYDLFTSIIKAEKIASEYVRFLQNLFESALWLEKDLGELDELPVERPDIAIRDMIPISRKELIEQESIAYEKGVQSRYETVKRLKPHDSEESIEDEMALLESESMSDDSTSLARGRTSLSNFLDNRDQDLEDEEDGPEEDPLQDGGNTTN